MEANGGWKSLGDAVGVDEGVGIVLVWDSDSVIVLVQDVVDDMMYGAMLWICIVIDEHGLDADGVERCPDGGLLSKTTVSTR